MADSHCATRCSSVGPARYARSRSSARARLRDARRCASVSSPDTYSIAMFRRRHCSSPRTSLINQSSSSESTTSCGRSSASTSALSGEMYSDVRVVPPGDVRCSRGAVSARRASDRRSHAAGAALPVCEPCPQPAVVSSEPSIPACSYPPSRPWTALLWGILTFTEGGDRPWRNDGCSYDRHGGGLRRGMSFFFPELRFEIGHHQGPSSPR